MMNSETKSQSSVRRNLPMVSFPCISRTTNVLAETAAMWAQKIYAYVQSELLAPVVQRLDNAIHRINRYPADKC